MVSRWRHGFLWGFCVAGGMGLLGAALIEAGSPFSDVGWIVLVFLSLPTGLVVAYYVHAVDSIMMTAVLAVVAWLPLIALESPHVIAGIGWVGSTMLSGAVVGALAGAILRSFVRRRTGS
jgi:hypothetical protein